MENHVMVYKGKSSDQLWVSFLAGTSWSGNELISNLNGGIDPRSDWPPAATQFYDKTFLIYKGSGTSQQIFVTTYDGTAWFGDDTVDDQVGSSIKPRTIYEPAIVIYHGIMHAIYIGEDEHFYHFQYDGKYWTGNTKISVDGRDPKTNHGVTLAVFADKIYTLYKGASDKDIRWLSFDGVNWTGDQKLKDQFNHIKPQTTDSNPGLVTYRNKLYAFYKGRDESRDIFVVEFDGGSWYGDSKLEWKDGHINQTPQTTKSPHCFTSHDSEEEVLNLVYKGSHSDQLYISQLIDTAWSGNNVIKVPSEDDVEKFPESNQSPNFATVPSIKINSFNWMTDNIKKIGDRPLGMLTLPSSHDSGMHVARGTSINETDYGKATRTQRYDVFSQILSCGSRVVDLRPVFYGSSIASTIDSGFYCGHFTTKAASWFGLMGQSLASICNNLREVLSLRGKCEILVITVSHGMHLQEGLGFQTLTKTEQQTMITMLLDACSGHLFTAKNCEIINFLEYTPNRILAGFESCQVLFVLDTESFDLCGKTQEDGCFQKNCFSTWSTWNDAKTDDLKTFLSDTENAIRSHSREKDRLFLAWQLTVIWYRSWIDLEKFAKELNPLLPVYLARWAGLFNMVNHPVAIGWNFLEPVNKPDETKDVTFSAVMDFNGLQA